MKLVAVSRILNESDIVEAFVRHTAHFVDHHILVDNGSVDGTLQILEKLNREGLGITVYQIAARSFVESKVLTFLYQTAVTRLQADWVVFLDADEFIDDRDLRQPLRHCVAAFASRHAMPACMQVPLREYRITSADPADRLIPRRMAYCHAMSQTLKVIVGGELIGRQAVIQPGSHSVLIDGAMACPAFPEPALSYAHYAVRSPYQWMTKSIIGWAKVLASGPATVRTGHAYHYQGVFETLRLKPHEALREARTMQAPAPASDQTHSPINYRGGPLKYTAETDYQLRAVQVLMQYLSELAGQHGELLELASRFAGLIGRTENTISRIQFDAPPAGVVAPTQAAPAEPRTPEPGPAATANLAWMNPPTGGDEAPGKQ